MKSVVLIGASGFVGSEVRDALKRRGAEVRCMSAPRLETAARELNGLVADVARHRSLPDIRALADSLAGSGCVVNAAGIAAATAKGDDLFGANALLPGLLAAIVPDDVRFVHISTAAVQGRRRRLDESEETEPFSPYSSSKALGEAAVWAAKPEAVCYRPTSVHGVGRNVTRSLVRVLGSPLASVAGSGESPTPQVRVENVGDAVAYLATSAETPPRVVLHPSENITTGELVRVLGGREPLRLPWWLTRSVVAIAFGMSRFLVPAKAGTARRLEMLWFGQDQDGSWLDERWALVKGLDTWKDLAR